MLISGFLVSLVVAVLLCWHAVKTGRDSFWLWIILMFQPIGGAVYFFLNVVPDIFGGTTAQKVSRAARETLDPNREYREAKLAHAETPTVRNQSRLAHAAAPGPLRRGRGALCGRGPRRPRRRPRPAARPRQGSLGTRPRRRGADHAGKARRGRRPRPHPARRAGHGPRLRRARPHRRSRPRVPVGQRAHAGLRGAGPLRRLHGPRRPQG